MKIKKEKSICDDCKINNQVACLNCKHWHIGFKYMSKNKIIDFENFIDYALDNGIDDIIQIEDFKEYYQNLLSLEENLKNLKEQIENEKNITK